MRLVDNNILQALGAAGLLPLLKHYPDLVVPRRVATEQRRTADPRRIKPFEQAIADGWLTIRTPPGDVRGSPLFRDLEPDLGATDAELAAWAYAEDAILFTDDRTLVHRADGIHVTALDLVDVLDELRRVGVLPQKYVERVVAAIEYEDGRTFTPADREHLGLVGR